MCGIFAIFRKKNVAEFRSKAVQLSKKLRHRGPDWSGVVISNDAILCHERLSIVGVESGAQPLSNEDNTVFLCVNGEIYNHMSLRGLLKGKHEFKTKSDCEIILHLWEEMGTKLVNHLDGMFSFVLYDAKQDLFFGARDHVGITTLYYGTQDDGSVWFASEMKALNENCSVIKSFPPGFVYLGSGSDASNDSFQQYYNPSWYAKTKIGSELTIMSSDQEAEMYRNIRITLEKSVQKRLMAEVPYGVLLSGGLDSSLIAAIAARHIDPDRFKDEENEDEDIRSSRMSALAFPRLHSFSIGLPGSPDLEAALKVAQYLKTVHHSFTFTIEEGLDSIEDVIYHLETYDVTTVRASTPMYLLSRKIKAIGIKMVLSGEGSDEIFAGYLYFHSAPNAEALHHECIDRIKNLHTSDCLRANKATMAWGLEARVPFLDKTFLDVAMSIPPSSKMYRSEPYNFGMEKHVLRKAFDTPQDPYLPEEILWRQKEQFSDGVGYSWIDSLRDHAEQKISDELMSKASTIFPHDTPTTKEGFWYRQVFESLFPQHACLESVVRWIPRGDWGCPSDPSGRAQKSHVAAYKE